MDDAARSRPPAADLGGGIYLSLGSNLGDREGNLRAGLEGLGRRAVRVLAGSSVYLTEPVGGPPQDPFLNLVVEVETTLPPEGLLAAALSVEDGAGRQRPHGPSGPGPRHGPRTLDVDLLLYRHLVLASPTLDLPHPRLHLRRFVLVPLAELRPELRHPSLGARVADLLAACIDRSAVERCGPFAAVARGTPFR